MSNDDEPAFEPHIEGVRYGALEDLSGYAVRRAQLLVTQAFDAAFAAHGLSTQRFSALTLIAENPGLTQTQLARIMGIARSQMSVVAEALLRAGLIVRKAVAADRRALALHLSPTGAKAFPRLSEAVRAHDAAITASLSAQDVVTLRHLLEKLSRSLRTPREKEAA